MRSSHYIKTGRKIFLLEQRYVFVICFPIAIDEGDVPYRVSERYPSGQSATFVAYHSILMGESPYWVIRCVIHHLLL